MIGDVAGKGIAAALLMANLQANLRSQCAVTPDQPLRVLKSVNHLFYENTMDGAYATLFFAEYEGKNQRLRYANCGHLSALLLRSDDTLERLDSTCTVLGLFEKWDCSIEERRVFSGDTLALYTDGVTESFTDTGEEFGEPRLIEAFIGGAYGNICDPQSHFPAGIRRSEGLQDLAKTVSEKIKRQCPGVTWKESF